MAMCMTDLRAMSDKHDKLPFFQRTQTYLHLILVQGGHHADRENEIQARQHVSNAKMSGSGRSQPVMLSADSKKICIA